MEGLVSDGQVTRGWIGVQPRDLDARVRAKLQATDHRGRADHRRAAGRPGQQAGMKPGDVVIRIGGKAVRNTSQLLNCRGGAEAAV
jgi:serine protease DegQ